MWPIPRGCIPIQSLLRLHVRFTLLLCIHSPSYFVKPVGTSNVVFGHHLHHRTCPSLPIPDLSCPSSFGHCAVLGIIWFPIFPLLCDLWLLVIPQVVPKASQRTLMVLAQQPTMSTIAPTPIDAYALVSQSTNHGCSRNGSSGRPRLNCDHCHRLGHTWLLALYCQHCPNRCSYYPASS